MAHGTRNTVTVIVVPDSNRYTLNFRLPVRLIAVGLTLLLTVTVALTVAVTVLLRSYHEASVAARERDELRHQATQREHQIHAMNVRVAEIETELAQLEELDNSVRTLLGQDKTAPGAASLEPGSATDGTGGPGNQGLNGLTLTAADVQSAAELFPPDTLSYLSDRRNTLALPSRTLAGPRPDQPASDGAVLDYLSSLREEVTLRTESLIQVGQALENYRDYQEHRPTGHPVWGRLTDAFGWRRSPWSRTKREFHAGMDLAVPLGTPVTATGAGKVIHAGWKAGGYGNVVMIDHGYGFITMYAHNSKVNAKVGEQVTRGDVIARAGSTGLSTGPHVHYEVWVSGRPVNPADYIE